jgi:hypothetical protein
MYAVLQLTIWSFLCKMLELDLRAAKIRDTFLNNYMDPYKTTIFL